MQNAMHGDDVRSRRHAPPPNARPVAFAHHQDLACIQNPLKAGLSA